MRQSRHFWPRDLRLRRREDFQKIVRRGHRLQTPHLTLWWRMREGCSKPRVGIRVSRRVSKKAVIRNRIRRRIREILRCHPEKIPAVDLVISARGLAASARYSHLERELLGALETIEQRIQTRKTGHSHSTGA